MYTLREAAEATGKSKSTIARAIEKGKLSATKDGNGHYQIDPSELHRVFPPKPSGDAGKVSHGTPHDALREASRNSKWDTDGTAQIRNMGAELEAANRIVEMQTQTIEDLRTRLDRSEEERHSAQTKLTALLTDQRPQTSAAQTKRKTHPAAWIASGVVITLLGAVSAFYYFGL